MATKRKTKKQRVLFKDGFGRFVKAEDRYKKATTVQVLRRGKYVTVIDSAEVTPTKLAQVTNRTEFESLPPAFKHIKRVEAKPTRRKKAPKDAAWQMAQQIAGTRGIRDKLVKITVTVRKGKRKRLVSFFHKIPKNKKTTYMLFKRLREASGGKELPFWYDIGEDDLDDLMEDDVNIEGAEIEQVL